MQNMSSVLTMAINKLKLLHTVEDVVPTIDINERLKNQWDRWKE